MYIKKYSHIFENLEDIITNLKLDFSFLENYSIKDFETFNNVVSQLLHKSNDLEIHLDDNTSSYLSICILAILNNEDKKSYRQLFEELRLRGIYKYLKPLVAYFKNNIESISDLSKSNYITNLYTFIKKIDTIDINNLDSILNISDKETDIKKYSDFIKKYDIIQERD